MEAIYEDLHRVPGRRSCETWTCSDEAVVRKSLPASPTVPAAVFRRGEVADAEPAVPTWRLPVDHLFR